MSEPSDGVSAAAELKFALEHRTIIGQAVGILVERHHLNAESALAALNHASQIADRELVDIAQELSDTGSTAGLNRLGPPAPM